MSMLVHSDATLQGSNPMFMSDNVYNYLSPPINRFNLILHGGEGGGERGDSAHQSFRIS